MFLGKVSDPTWDNCMGQLVIGTAVHVHCRSNAEASSAIVYSPQNGNVTQISTRLVLPLTGITQQIKSDRLTQQEVQYSIIYVKWFGIEWCLLPDIIVKWMQDPECFLRLSETKV